MALLYLGAAILAGAGVGFGASKALQSALRKARDDRSKRAALWNRFYAIDWGDTSTNNYGFAPADGSHPERHQHQMYLEMLKLLREKRALKPGMKLLEVSCGRGGGLSALLANAPELHAVGLDVAEPAVTFCRKTHGENDRLSFVQGSAMELPFADSSFDVVLNVEASNDYPDRNQFFREVARVLKPDGVFLYTDTMKQKKIDKVKRGLGRAGFEAEFRDVTGNVVEACRLDSPRRREVIRRQAPLAGRLLFGRQLEDYAAIEGSPKFNEFANRERLYLMTAAVKA